MFLIEISIFYNLNLFCNQDDDYDNDSAPYRERSSGLDDIKDWQSGNKSAVEEAFDKVKEFVGGIKIFDAPEDFKLVLQHILFLSLIYSIFCSHC